LGSVLGIPSTRREKNWGSPLGLLSNWSHNFNTCPEDDNEDVIKMYARVYVWYVITRTLFNDASGKTENWHWL
jgi:hypothetical protein